jgi:hypothetical protein
MDPARAIEWAGGTQTALAERLGLSRAAVSLWVQEGRVPLGRAYQIQVLSDGYCTVDPELYRDEVA